MKYLLLLSFILIFIVDKTIGCSCVPVGRINYKEVKKYDIIFKGSVLRIDTLEESFSKNIVFKINVMYKGEVKADTIVINSPLKEGACGIRTKLKEEWLLFGYNNGGIYITSLCTRSISLVEFGPRDEEQVKEDISFLENWKKRGNVTD